MNRRSLGLAAALVLLAGLSFPSPTPPPASHGDLRIDVRGQRLLLGRALRPADPQRPLSPRPEAPCAGALRTVEAGGVVTLVLPATPSPAPVLYRDGVPGGRTLDVEWSEGAWSCRRGGAGAPWSVELAEPADPVRWSLVLPAPTSGTAAVTFTATGSPPAGFRVTPHLNLVESTSGTSPAAEGPTRLPLGDLDLGDEVAALGALALDGLPPILLLTALALAASAVRPSRKHLRHPLAALALTLLVLAPGREVAAPALLVCAVWWGLAPAEDRPLPLWRVAILTLAALGLALLHPLPGTALLLVTAAAVAARPGDDRSALRGLALVATLSAVAVLLVPFAAPVAAADVGAALRTCGFSRSPEARLPWGEPGFGPARAVANLRLALQALAGTLGPALALWPLGCILLGARSQGDVVLPCAALLTLLAATASWRPDLLPTCILALLAACRALLLILTWAEEDAP